jgi:hypothetical protein
MARHFIADHEEYGPGGDLAADSLIDRALGWAAGRLPADRDEELLRHFLPEIAAATGSDLQALRDKLASRRAVRPSSPGGPAEARSSTNGQAAASLATDGRIPRSAVRPLPPYQPFPIYALPAPLKSYCEEAAAALGCDVAYVALAAC